MRKTIIAACFGLVIAVPAAYAQDSSAKVDGIVTKVDQAGGTITLKHGDIPNIQMEAMTMAYPVKDPAMLKGLKAGDKVKFQADMVNGEASVTEIEKAK
jgi:Cu(I)/Ag(I) efflux system protein CusF